MARDLLPQQSQAILRPGEDRSRKQNFLEPAILQARVKEITANHSVQATQDAQTYIALALQARLTATIKQCVGAVDHRLDTQYTRPPPLYPITPNPTVNPDDPPPEPLPMWSLLVRRDVVKQLAALEKMEKEEETRARRRRQERNENEGNANGSMDAGGDDMDEDDSEESRKRKKKKKDGPGVTAKNMSEEVRVKMSDFAANAAGALPKKYSWMTSGVAATTPALAAKPAAPKPATTTTATTTTPATGGFVRPFVTKQASATAPENPDERRITIADLMFVVGKERGHGAGRGSARTWSVAGW